MGLGQRGQLASMCRFIQTEEICPAAHVMSKYHTFKLGHTRLTYRQHLASSTCVLTVAVTQAIATYNILSLYAKNHIKEHQWAGGTTCIMESKIYMI